MIKKYQVVTLNEFIIQQQSAFPYAKGELSRLLTHIGIAGKLVNREVNNAGLVDILGDIGNVNIQGELQKKLDVFANDQFLGVLGSSGEICGIVSEENNAIVEFDNPISKKGKYVVCLDPLDGSSNIDVNISVGTIFSIYTRVSPAGSKPTEEDFLQPGIKQVAAGYIVYGSSTMLVYTTGSGVTGFTLDPSIGEFCLSNLEIKIPEKGNIYSINDGYYAKFSDGLKKYIDYCHEDDPASGRPYSARYIGSMVADFHRNLLKGGIYIYPEMSDVPHGKLRLIYECNPMAFLTEQAGGIALDQFGRRIMDITPQNIHERTPFYAGSKDMVKKVMSFVKPA